MLVVAWPPLALRHGSGEVVGSRPVALWIKSKAMLMIHVRGSTVYKNEGAEHEKIGTPVCFACSAKGPLHFQKSQLGCGRTLLEQKENQDAKG